MLPAVAEDAEVAGVVSHTGTKHLDSGATFFLLVDVLAIQS